MGLFQMGIFLSQRRLQISIENTPGWGMYQAFGGRELITVIAVWLSKMVSEDEVHSFPSFSKIVIDVIFCMAANDNIRSFGTCFFLSEDKGTYIS